jgi:hypothetical protein
MKGGREFSSKLIDVRLQSVEAFIGLGDKLVLWKWIPAPGRNDGSAGVNSGQIGKIKTLLPCSKTASLIVFSQYAKFKHSRDLEKMQSS